MLLVAATSAFQSGVTIVMLKLVTELGQTKEFRTHIGLGAFMILVVVISGTIQLHMLNLAMKYYDQLEVMPVY